MIGLGFITILSALQYGFLHNVPANSSKFSFLFVTNLLGFIILTVINYKKIKGISKSPIKKGFLLSIELIGFTYFLLSGSKDLDNVVISSIISMYFIYVTPILLLLKKRVNFFSGVAATLALIALLLMFGGDINALIGSKSVLYLIVADIFFAAYVVSISLLGENEDSTQLTLSQMGFAVCLSLIGWIIESILTGNAFTIPADTSFWISAIFIGVCIRAIYGIVQISCIKHVPTLNASLIFSSEIMITLGLNPFVCKVLHTTYTPTTIYQVIGCILLLISTLMVEDKILSKLGYDRMDIKLFKQKDGTMKKYVSISRKIIVSTLLFTLATLILSTSICLLSIQTIQSSVVDNSKILGKEASISSMDALKEEMEKEQVQNTSNKAIIADEILKKYASSIELAANYASSLYANPNEYTSHVVDVPKEENDGKWIMQRILANESISYASIQNECNLLSNMISVFDPIIQQNENVYAIYIGTETGLFISYDKNSSSKYNNGKESYYEFRQSEWYTLGKNNHPYRFTNTYEDAYNRGLTISCFAPFYDKKGNFIGCVSMDILIENLNKAILNESNISILINENGNIISTNDENAEKTLKDIKEEIIKNKEGILSYNDQYIAYATIPSTGWILCFESPISSIIDSVSKVQDKIDTNTNSMVDTIIKGIRTIVQNCLILSAIILLGVTILLGKATKKISNPLVKLEEDVKRISNGELDFRTSVDTDDEIGNLARSFNEMSESLQKHIADLKEVTAREERIASELALATQIQKHMIPSVFPAFPDRPDIDLYAIMHPAKEVGGDFYDYFEIDDTHVGLVMADVSGKGIPAALFMMISMALIKNEALNNPSPASVLMKINNSLCEKNDAGMFVTVWLGIMDTVSGKMICCNAGHEYPIIARKDGPFELYKDKHGFIIGGMEDIRYKEYELTLEKGDILYVYTDGVPEATNPDNELFGIERIIDSLNNHERDPKALIAGIIEDTTEFVKEAEPFDDMTMMVVKRI